MRYNIIDQPWIHVLYKDRRPDVLSVRSVLKDAKQIQSLATPTFHRNKLFFYEFCALRFLVTVILAAYYKPEQKFAPARKTWKDELLKNGLYSDVIKEYLDRYYNRFDLFDEERPFLQDATWRYKLEKTAGNEYIAKMNPLAPGENTPIFGHWCPRTPTKDVYEEYRMTIPEFVYILLYWNSIGNSINGKNYTASLTGSAGVFAVPIGDNLCETVLKNCLQLNNSDRPNADEPDKKFDRPVWELDSVRDAYQYSDDSLYKNVLLCSYFPSKPIISSGDDTGYITNALFATKTEIATVYPELMHILPALTILYPQSAPNAIHKKMDSPKNKKKEEFIGYNYKTYEPLPAWMFLVFATSKVDGKNACPVLEGQEKGFTTIYFRGFDKMKSNILISGRVSVPESVNVPALLNDDAREKMSALKNLYDDVEAIFKKALTNMGVGPAVASEQTSLFSSWVERYVFDTYIPNINEEDCYETAKGVVVKEAIRRLDDIAQQSRCIIPYLENKNKLIKKLKKKKEKNNANK